MLCNFENEANRVALNLERVENVGQVALELHIHDGTDDLSDRADSGFLGTTSLGGERASLEC